MAGGRGRDYAKVPGYRQRRALELANAKTLGGGWRINLGKRRGARNNQIFRTRAKRDSRVFESVKG